MLKKKRIEDTPQGLRFQQYMVNMIIFNTLMNFLIMWIRFEQYDRNIAFLNRQSLMSPELIEFTKNSMIIENLLLTVFSTFISIFIYFIYLKRIEKSKKGSENNEKDSINSNDIDVV